MLQQRNTLANKQEYNAVDFLRFFLSLAVVALHLDPFAQFNTAFNDWTCAIATRIAVPTFFVISGYFAARKLENAQTFWPYFKRLLLFYLGYNLLYLPQTLYICHLTDASVADYQFYLHLFLVKGISDHLWFFLALASAMLILFCMKKFWSMRVIFVLLALLYLVGMLLHSFHDTVLTIPFFGRVLAYYYRYFFTLRNGIFLGLPLAGLGYAFYYYRDKIKLTKWYWLAFALAFALMNLEGLTKQITDIDDFDLYWSYPLVAAFLFLSICSVNVSPEWHQITPLLRKISVVVYGVHMTVYFQMAVIWDVHFGYRWSNWEIYLSTCLASIVIGAVIVTLSRYKCFAFLKYLY